MATFGSWGRESYTFHALGAGPASTHTQATTNYTQSVSGISHGVERESGREIGQAGIFRERNVG